MAVVSIKCPQCGGQLEFEDSDRDYGFCTFCGTKVQLHEIVSVKHSGSVQLDNSKQAENRTMIAGRAFLSRNYTEATEYYTKVLEDMPDDYVAIYRKGICAVYLSSNENPRITEFDMSMRAAQPRLPAYSQATGKPIPDVQAQKDKDIVEMLKTLYSSVTTDYPVQSFIDNCAQMYNRWVSFLNLTSCALNYIDTESAKDAALFSAVDFCDALSRKRVAYYAGTETDKDGNVKQKVEQYALKGPQKKTVESARKEFANAYNTLPSRVERQRTISGNIDRLNEEIARRTETVREKTAAMKTARAEFWKANPELAAIKRKKILPGLVVFAALLLAGILVAVLSKQYASYGPFLPIAGAVLGFIIARSGMRSYEKSVMTDAVREMEDELEEEARQLEERKKALKAEQAGKKEFERSLK